MANVPRESGFGDSLDGESPVDWGRLTERAVWLTRRVQASDQDLGATTMNEKGDDRRLALEQGVGADAPDDEVARVLKADHAAGLRALRPFPLG